MIHILHYGLPRCRFSSDLPVHWPEGHRWVGFDDMCKATCPACIRSVPLTSNELIVLSSASGNWLRSYGPDSLVHDLIKRGLLKAERRWWSFKTVQLTWAGEVYLGDEHSPEHRKLA